MDYMTILGINAYHGDGSAVILKDGKLKGAVEEERFRRIKHWAGFPSESIRVSLQMARLNPTEIDYFAVSRDPKANLARKALFTILKRPNPGLVKDRTKNRAQIGRLPETLAGTLGLDQAFVRSRMRWIEHHPTHLSSAFFVSPFEEAAVCAIDGFGDFVSTSFAIGRGNNLDVTRRIFFPHSLGLLYLAITQYLGFPEYGDEFKVMGLAPYGTPEFVPALRKLVALTPGGGFELDLSYFSHVSGGGMMTWMGGQPKISSVYTPKLIELLGPARDPGESLGERHAAIAASLQVVFEEAAFHLLNELQRSTRLKRLCIAGGCAMNSVMNGKIRERTPFREVYIQAAAGDNGTSLGAAAYVWHQLMHKPRGFVMNHAYLGPEFSDEECRRTLDERQQELAALSCQIQYISEIDRRCGWAADRIAQGKIVGWFQGRMEWGARALGNRSILADPRRADMREIINTKIKFREKFRPFAPSILEERFSEYFSDAVADPFMLQVYPILPQKRNIVPAVTHVDGSGRIQTVNQAANPLYWQLLRAFELRTGVPILLNTSFNENEPIVHKPEEALDCFLRTRMDVLVLGGYAIEKIN
jgi:carbamoyltransferase